MAIYQFSKSLLIQFHFSNSLFKFILQKFKAFIPYLVKCIMHKNKLISKHWISLRLCKPFGLKYAVNYLQNKS